VKLPDASGVDLIKPAAPPRSPDGEIILNHGVRDVDTAISALRAGAFAFVLNRSGRGADLDGRAGSAKVTLKREREELERRYRALVEAADVLIVALDQEGKIRAHEPRTAALAAVTASGGSGAVCRALRGPG